MIIARQLIQVPYKKYLVLVKGVAVRKLTIMEWTLLRVVNDYSINPLYRDKALSYFFEKILGISQCELLIRPCMTSLQRMGLIQISGYSSFTLASDTIVGRMQLTEVGRDALLHNYTSGESKDTEECVYYDLVGQKAIDYIPVNGADADSGKKITSSTRFKMDCPVGEIIAAINNGFIFQAKYKRNNIVVQEITCNSEENIWCTGELRLDQDEQGTLKCNYPVCDDIFVQVKKMVETPYGTAEKMIKWDPIQQIPANAFFAKGIQSDVEKMIDYASYIAVPNSVWPRFEVIEKNRLRGMTCLVFGCEKYCIESDGHITVSLPFPLSNSNTLLVIPDADEIHGASFSGQLEGRSLDICFTFHDPLEKSNFGYWFPQKITEYCIEYPEITALLFLPFVKLSVQKALDSIRKRMSYIAVYKEKLFFIAAIYAQCSQLHIKPPSFDCIYQDVVKSMNLCSAECAKDDLQAACILLSNKCSPEEYENMVVRCAAEFGLQSGIADCISILTAAFFYNGTSIDRVSQAADALIFSRVNGDELDLLFSSFADNYPELLPNISWIALSFNSVIKGMKELSGVLPALEWYSNVDREALLENTINCAELGNASDQLTELWNEVHKLESLGCSVFSEDGCCYGISVHMQQLSDIFRHFIVPDKGPKAIYIVDTCAFLHSPDILDYFHENEMVRIPFTVIRELDYHKDSDADINLKRSAAFVCKQIEAKSLVSDRSGKLDFAVETKDYPELLPSGFDSRKHDDLILSAALRYKLFSPHLLTDDTNFRNIARTQGITPVAWTSFIKERGGNPKRGQVWVSEESSAKDYPQSTAKPFPANSPLETTRDTENADGVISTPSSMAQKFRITLLHSVAKRYSLNDNQISMLNSKKILTCDDLLSTDDSVIRSMFKKKSFLAERILDAKRKISSELARLTEKDASTR